MKPRYDLAFGIGTACSCSQTLRGAGLQLLSFPFDWITLRDESADRCDAIACRIDHICRGFPDWFAREDFHTLGENNGDHLTNGMLDCFNERLQMRFLHDFPRTQSLDESFPAVRTKYRRRIDRLLSLLDGARRVLVFRMERPNQAFETPLESFRSARAKLTARYPKASFDFIAFRLARGIPFERRKIERPETWLTVVSFDYRSPDPKAPPHEPNMSQTIAALGELASVRDYRTPEERKAKRRKDRQKAYARFGATNWLQYRLAKLRARIARRLSRHQP